MLNANHSLSLKTSGNVAGTVGRSTLRRMWRGLYASSVAIAQLALSNPKDGE